MNTWSGSMSTVVGWTGAWNRGWLHTCGEDVLGRMGEGEPMLIRYRTGTTDQLAAQSFWVLCDG